MLDRTREVAPFPELTEEEKKEIEEEWADYVPDPLNISEEQWQKAREGLEEFIAWSIEEFGEPTAEEKAHAEAWWRRIEEHLTKDTRQ